MTFYQQLCEANSHRLPDIYKFQDFIHQHTGYENREECIRLSRQYFGPDQYGTDILNYEKLVFHITSITSANYIVHEELPTATRLSCVYVIIPCNVLQTHKGVHCRLVDHLLGIGCGDCAKHFGLSPLFPMEEI